MAYRYLLVLRPLSQTLVAYLGPGEVLAFDGEGRLRQGRLGGRIYRRGLEGRVLERARPPAGRWSPGGYRFLPAGEADGFLAGAHARLHEAAAGGALRIAVASPGERELLPAPDATGRSLLGRLSRWSAARYREDAARCRAVYAPVGILPPDRYGSLVVQATRGCSFNACRFCDSFRGVPFHAREPREFRAHVREVRAYLGRGLAAYRSLFLGSANALHLPTDHLEGCLRVLEEELPEEAGPCPAHGVHAFVDAFTGERKTAGEYARLAGRGLRTVYVGLESGSDALRAWLGKPGGAEEYVELARAAKGGGLTVAVMVLAWAGGRAFAAEHESQTPRVLRAMGLDAGDTIFLSPLVAPRDRPAAEGLFGESPLDESARADQLRSLVESVPPVAAGGPRVRRYDVAEFLY